MKRIFTTLAAVAGMAASAGMVQAQPGGYPPQMGGYPPQMGGYASPAGGYGPPSTLFDLGAAKPGQEPNRYGLLPGLRRAFRFGGDTCDTCGVPSKHGHAVGCGAGGCGPFGHGQYGAPGYGQGQGGQGGYGPYGPYGAVNQGTLVFPHHTYVRSPRDYFMTEPQK